MHLIFRHLKIFDQVMSLALERPLVSTVSLALLTSLSEVVASDRVRSSDST